jgi:hypothetical protein
MLDSNLIKRMAKMAEKNLLQLYNYIDFQRGGINAGP